MANLDLIIRARNEAQAALNELDKSLGGLRKQAGGLSGGLAGLGNVLKVGLVAGAAAGAAALGAVGAAAFGVAQSFEDAQHTLIAATGASGAALDGMSQSVVALHGSVAGLDRSMADIAAVMGEVNTRTGATGPALDTFTAQILKMTRITGDDGVAAVAGITRVMGDWSVPLEESSGLMDKLFGAGQAFGIGLDSLAGKLVQFGAPLRQMGFGLDESIAMLGKWEKEGVNTELVIGSLRIAAGKFAKEQADVTSALALGENRAISSTAANKSLAESLRDTFFAIKNASDGTAALNIGMEVFGARAGPDMTAAIREGRFELDDAIKAMDGMAGSIDDVATRTLGLSERWQMGMTQVKDSLLPVGNELMNLGLQAMPFVEAAAAGLAEFLSTTLPGVIGDVREAWDDDWGGIRSAVADTVSALSVEYVKMKFQAALFVQDLHKEFEKSDVTIDWTGLKIPVTEKAQFVLEWEDMWKYLGDVTGRGVVLLIGGQLNFGLGMLRGTWQFVSGLLTGDWERMWGGLETITHAGITFIDEALNIWGDGTAEKIRGAFDLGFEWAKEAWFNFSRWLDGNIFAPIHRLNEGLRPGTAYERPPGVPGGVLPPGFATGTNFAPGGWAMVGERGPELVNLPRGSQVLPANETANRVSNSAPVTINNYVTVNSEQDIVSLTERILSQIRRQQNLQAWQPTF